MVEMWISLGSLNVPSHILMDWGGSGVIEKLKVPFLFTGRFIQYVLHSSLKPTRS